MSTGEANHSIRSISRGSAAPDNMDVLARAEA